MSDKVTGFENGCCGPERRATIVSFSHGRDEVSLDSEDDESAGGCSEDEFQILQVLDPYIQTYLAHGGEGIRCYCCCGLPLPVPFERASRRSWWDPRFDSEILEKQYRRSSLKQIRLWFRYAMAYMAILSLIWSIYLLAFGIVDRNKSDAFPLAIIYFFYLLFSLGILWFTRSSLYRQYLFPASLTTAVSLCFLSVISVGKTPVLSPTTDFAICIEVLIIIYTVIPLPLYMCVLVAVFYSVTFEILGTGHLLLVRVLCHLSVHLIAIHILIMTNVRMRGTFMKVGQSLLVRRQLEMEKHMKKKMIHSVMPPKVADWLMEEGGEQFLGGDIDSLFRPFHMSCMKDVSILFADIVGFTRMSSKKTASELVSVLNELFERFDDLCSHHGCEKISTLGDCYYCVSGCPTPREDHAQCCVNMGLGMIKAIAEFDREKHEDVNMRVGVHTGTVLCGIVGRRRFKFDVWSNDVTFANKMESTGQPGRVHISEATKSFLGDFYELEPGEEIDGVNTYFITERTNATQNSGDASYETAVTSHGEDSILVTADSQIRSCRSSSNVNCTISPFETITDSRLFSEMSSTPSPSPVATSPPTHLLSLNELLSEAKAVSLPNVFGRDAEVGTGSSETPALGSGPLVTKKVPLRQWKYSKLRLNSLGRENGQVKKTYKPPSDEPSHNEKAVNTQLEVPKDDLSFCQSVNSRKDSGIRSNSRRSSIQQQLYVMNGLSQGELLQHRVSGYYTSSQSSLNCSEGKGKGPKLPAPGVDSLGACFQKIRKQSDQQLIRCVKDNSKSERSYFVSPPLKRWSLLFKHPEMEKEYREKAHRSSPIGQNKSRTLATARFNTYFDVIVSLLVFASVSISSFAIFPLSIPWMTIFLLLLSLQLVVVFLCIHSIVKPILTRRLKPLLKWYPWHAVGSILVSLPLIAVLINFGQSTISKDYLYNYTYLVFVGTVHYCNFTQLNCWMKSTLATLGAIFYLVLITTTVVNNPQLMNVDNSSPAPDNTSVLIEPTWLPSAENEGNEVLNPQVYNFDPETVVTSRNDSIRWAPTPRSNLLRSTTFLIELYLNVFLLVLLVWCLNREFEISYRLSFHGNVVAARDKAKVESMKLQADLLLDNILPKHVAEQLNFTARYSEDVKNAGIIFAKITNFDEMYDETYLDGKECLRVLNELVSDFDELLSQPRFHMVEKIKTIGSTFMAASGLNSSQRKENSNEHLFQLMEFALALQSAIDNFNTHLLSFKFILRVGYNFGDVTAGVIGTSKLYYDIWGDAVNIASRMDSTGVANRIQVPASCLSVLQTRYELEYRGTVFVKGKDNMEVYLLKGHKQPGSPSP